MLALLDQTLIGAATRVALEADTASGTSQSFTFGELEIRSNRVAQLLSDRGITRGSRLAFLLTNRVEIVDLWLACVKLGAIAVPINVLYQAREIAHIVGDAAPVAVVTTRDRLDDVAEHVEHWDVDDLERDAHARTTIIARPQFVRDTVCHADTPLALVYTSGTTGASKGARSEERRVGKEC